MCVRKSAEDNDKLSAQRGLHSILDGLRKRMEVKEIWIVQEGGSIQKSYDDKIDVYNAFSFKDGTEIIRILSPNLVLIPNDYEYLHRSILEAAKSQRVPTVDLLSSAFGLMELNEGYDKRKIFGTLQLLKDHPTSIIKRYLFLLRTLYRAGSGLGYIFKTILKDIYLPFINWTPRYKFGGGDLNIVSTPDWADLLVKNRIERSKIAVTGDISMDTIHYKLANIKSEHLRTTIGKTQILFITSPMVEHGLWTEEMRKDVVIGVVTAIREQLRDYAMLRIKIHPTSESLDVYKELLNPLDPSLEIIQEADLLSLISNSDIVVCYGHSSAILEAVLLKRPVFIMNILNKDTIKNYYLQENIVTECKSTDELIGFIKNRSYRVIDSERLNAFLAKYVYLFDGKCSERAVEHIVSLLSSWNSGIS